MGWLSDIGNAISNAAEAVGDAVTDVVDTVTDAVGGVVETVGNAVADGLDAAAGAVSGIPGVGGFLSGALGWASNVVSGATQFVATAIRAVGNIVANVAGGLIKVAGGVLGGVLSGDFGVAGEGLSDMGTAIFGGIVAILGTGVAFVQGVFFLQPGERPLTADELAILMRVYRGSVNFWNVRIIEGWAGLFSVNDRPFTLGNRMYMKDYDPAKDSDTLVHECGHVWQNQNEGTKYIGGALWAQWTLKDAYSWEDELAGGKTEWIDFNKEAQAAFIEDVYRSGVQVPPVGVLGEFYNDDPVGTNVSFKPGGTDLTEFARTSVAVMRAA